MHRLAYRKSDGRNLWLYSRLAVQAPVSVPQSGATTPPAAGHLRWHPLLAEWVIYAQHRQDRTFLPDERANPLARTTDPQRPTELPAGNYDVAVFDNRFPSLTEQTALISAAPGVECRPARGRCEVVVFSGDPRKGLGELPVDYIAFILEVLADRTRELAAAGLRYVLPFENRGPEMGVTLHHPHGQIYAYAFVPALQQRAASNLRGHLARTGQDLVTELAASELAVGTRMVAERPHAIALVPPFARFPYECWIIPKNRVRDLTALSEPQRRDMAALLAEVLRRLDGLWQLPMPYLMTFNQAPFDGEEHPEWSLRIEIWPIRRAREKLKFLAGTELGAGAFTADMIPEQAAAELRAVPL